LGRIQIMSKRGRKLSFPVYSTLHIGNLRVPDPSDARAIGILSECFEKTKEQEVPQYRDGDNHVRKAWDEAVKRAMPHIAEAIDIDTLRQALNGDPYVTGRRRGYVQAGDEGG